MRLFFFGCLTVVFTMGAFTVVFAEDDGIPPENSDRPGISKFVKPAPEIGHGPAEKPDEFTRAERIALRKIKTTEYDKVFAVARGIVVDTEPVLFSFVDSNGEPRFDIYTKITANISNTYRNQLPANIVFWAHGGEIEEENRIIGFPYSIARSNDIRFDVGDEFLACLQANGTLPDGRTGYKLFGSELGVTFPESPQSDLDAAVAAIVEAHLAATQRSFP